MECAVSEQHDCSEPDEQVSGDFLSKVILLGFDLTFSALIDRVMKNSALSSFGCETFDNLDPEELLDDTPIRERHVLLCFTMARSDRGSEVSIGHELQWEDDDRSHREFDVHDRDHDDQNLELENIEREERELLLDKGLNFVGIIHHTSANLAGLV